MTASQAPSLLVERLAATFLLATMLVYPFSVAATNVFLFLLILLSIIKIDLIKHGLQVCWFEYRAITIGVLCYIALTLIGALWSEDTDKTIHKMLKQFKWLVIPTIIGVIYYFPQLKKKAFILLSIGLSLHLVVCTLQYLGLIHITKLGSNAYDAAGFIGHLSLGFIYGLWVGSLVVAAQSLQKKWAYLCYILAMYATVTVFLAQGRSGYITTIAMLFLVAWKVLFPKKNKLKLATLAGFTLLIALFFTLHATTHQRILNAMSGVNAYLHGDWQHTDMRIKIWATSIELWKENPWFGIGTGDYKPASIEILKKPEFKHLRQSLGQGDTQFASSHNEFIFNLTRWGPLGLLATLYLCWSWFITGWRKDWKNDTMNAYLCAGSGLTVILHGLTEVSLNSQLETTFATIVLAFAMTQNASKEVKVLQPAKDKTIQQNI